MAGTRGDIEYKPTMWCARHRATFDKQTQKKRKRGDGATHFKEERLGGTGKGKGMAGILRNGNAR